MNSMDLLDAIGTVDDILLKKAKEKPKSYKAVWTAVGTIAACFLLIVMLPAAFMGFLSMNGRSNEESLRDSEASGFDSMYVRIDVETYKDDWSFVSYDSMKAIHEAIVGITDPLVKEDGNNQIQQETAKDKSSTSTSAESASNPESGEYIITLYHNDGCVIRYSLRDTTLTNRTTGESYSLTQEEAEYLLSLIQK